MKCKDLKKRKKEKTPEILDKAEKQRHTGRMKQQKSLSKMTM